MDDSMTMDNNTDLRIRATDNGLKDGDLQSPQAKRALTDEEVVKLIEEAGAGNDDC